MRTLSRLLFFIGLLAAASALRAEEPVRIFAAASLTNALGDIAVQWQKGGHPAPSLAFGASSTLAKQIEAGAPADLFAAADLSWMEDRPGIADQSVGQRADAYRSEGSSLSSHHGGGLRPR